MDALIVQGGNRLSGKVIVPPAKNAALPLLCLSLLTDQKVEFTRLPKVQDIESMCSLLKEMGVDREGESSFRCSKIKSIVAPYDWVTKMRASILVLGPLLAREGRAEVSLPGGCAIGERPVDIHLEGLKALGAKINLENGYIKAECARLKGARFVMHFPTVTGTINLMTAAVLAEGDTTLENVAHEPEIIEMAQALKKMGAKIEGEGTSQIRIQGVTKLGGLSSWEILPDRIQLLTYLAAAAITGGDVVCEPYRKQTLNAVLQKFQEMDCTIEEMDNAVKIRAPKGRLRPAHIETAPFPGFPTDGQAQFMACLSVADAAKGGSAVRELVFENRFGHVGELRRMGAQIEVKGNTALVQGVEKLSGAKVMASDLRASACLVLAGLAAEGKTQVSRVYHLDRGYENLEGRLRDLGAKIDRIKE